MYLDRLFAPALLVATLAATAGAQQPAPSLPTPPASIAYRYWPRQFVQWVGPELPYSMVELDLDDRSPKPLYDAILTDRASHKRVHYTNDAAELALERATGAEAYLVPMQFDLPEAPANGATYTLRFATEKNVPVVWQFVQGSDMSEKGSGLTAIPGAAPELLYREAGCSRRRGYRPQGWQYRERRRGVEGDQPAAVLRRVSRSHLAGCAHDRLYAARGCVDPGPSHGTSSCWR